MKRSIPISCSLVIVCLVLASPSAGQLPGEGPRLGPVRITQQQVESGEMSLRDLRREGQRIFSTPFNKLDGYGDGPMDPNDATTPGGRPTLQDNGTFLRVNGLDGQSCLECHSIVSNASIPAKFGIGGVGGSVTNAMFLPTLIDVSDSSSEGFAAFDGRFINPPFLFGTGGVELLGKEMTVELQALKAFAQQHPAQDVPLVTKGVSFGVIRYNNGAFDTADVEGIDDDLVVRPFGRKGELATVRGFDEGAMQFHFGMQPIESVGADVDGDGDGVANEILTGELSVLAIFNTNLESPQQEHLDRQAAEGAELFQSVGCADCHVPALATAGRVLAYSFPEVPTDPTANVYYQVDLSTPPTKFKKARGGGLTIPLFADLKRHNMGDDMAESFGSPNDAMFTTAKLWGVADTAPYMHDGRALTISSAILMHGGEGQIARDSFAALDVTDQAGILAFLQTLRTPHNSGNDLGNP